MPASPATFDGFLFDLGAFDRSATAAAATYPVAHWLAVTRAPAPATPATPVILAPAGSGYFTPFLTSYFTPYFPGAGAGSSHSLAPAVGLAPPGYFTGFLPSYFTNYFPGAGGVPLSPPVVGTPVLPGTFVAAVRKALMGDATLGGMVRGGFWHRFAPRGTPRPYVVYAADSLTPEGIGGPHYIQSGQFRLVAYGSPAVTARAIADQAARSLSDRVPDLTWSHGRLMMFRAASPASPDRPTAAPGGANLQAETRQFDYMLSGRFDA